MRNAMLRGERCHAEYDRRSAELRYEYESNPVLKLVLVPSPTLHTILPSQPRERESTSAQLIFGTSFFVPRYSTLTLNIR